MSLRISYSSSNTFLGCNRKFYYEKIRDFSKDPDFEDNSTALRLGKAFHQVLENALHERKNLNKVIFQDAFNDNDILSDTERSYIKAMVYRYLKLHEKSGLIVKAVEIEIGNVDYLGYVDAIMFDRNGNWWIVDLKTASQLSNSLLSRLSRDPQLNVYSYFRDQVAKLCNLEPDHFAGVRYRVTTKPRFKMKKGEDPQDFVKRCAGSIDSYDIGISVDALDPGKAFGRLMRIRREAEALAELEEEDVPQNFTYCESYFKPCPYWSRCYGSTFSEASKQHIIYDSENIIDLTQSVIDDDLQDL